MHLGLLISSLWLGMFLFSWFRSFYHGSGGTISALGTQWVNAQCRIVLIFYANVTTMMRCKTDEVEKTRYRQYSSHCVEQLWYLVFSISSKKLIKIWLFTCIASCIEIPFHRWVQCDVITLIQYSCIHLPQEGFCAFFFCILVTTWSTVYHYIWLIDTTYLLRTFLQTQNMLAW